MRVNVIKIPQRSPDDLTGLVEAIASNQLDPSAIAAIMGKTEGNGCVNDFTRGFAVATLQGYLAPLIGQEACDRIVFVMSGGTEGVISPHLTVFTREDSGFTGSGQRGLALGVHHTREFSATEIGTMTMVRVVADGVKQAIASADLTAADVHFVQIKCPLIVTSAQHEGATVTRDSYKSMAYSRGAAALGVAVALGKIDGDRLSDADICSNYDLYSRVASASAGVELQNCEILALGNSPHSHSDFVIGHSVMQHALDTNAVREAIASAGGEQDSRAIANVFAKAEADPSGFILGCRHTMLDDSDINHTRMARAVVGAVVASVTGDPMAYISGGSEHQGPPGGGAIAVICKRT